MAFYENTNRLCVFHEETSTSKVENNNFKNMWNQNYASETTKSFKKVEQQWTEQDIKDALHHYISTPGATIRGTANRFGIGNQR